MTLRLPPVSAALLALVACEGGRQPDGTMDVAWTGADTTRYRVEASAIWCTEGGWLEVTGLVGDTGVGVVVYPRDSVPAGNYAVHDPADSLGRGAAVAIRWFGENAVHALQSRTGSVSLTQDTVGVLSGTFDAKVVSIMRPETLVVKGVIQRVAVTPGDASCAGISHTAPADTSVD
ncbi:MAG: hypothetical protein HKM89_06785 [Gemmatimonadales bacterium]|nr:hypothetical protein [Gemmatimonadales bacterium]